MVVRVVRGDCREVLRTLPASSVHVAVTSPPYVNIRSYMADAGDPRAHLEIGRSSLLSDYVREMVEVFAEVRRVLHPSGTLWLNLGDRYMGSGNGPPGGGTLNGVAKHGTGGGGSMPPSEGFKAKDLALVGPRVAWALQGFVTVYGLDMERAANTLREARERGDWIMVEAVESFLRTAAAPISALAGQGWWLRSLIVWAKRSGLPERWVDRPTGAHEMIFLFAKGRKYYYDHFAVREPARSKESHGQNLRNVWAQDDAWPMADVWWLTSEPLRDEEHNAAYASRIPNLAIRAGSSEHGCCPTCLEPWVRLVAKVGEVGSGGSSRRITDMERPEGQPKLGWNSGMRTGFTPVWEHRGWEPRCGHGHLAPIPCTVLDPFAGSGTTLREADRLGRDALGIELSPVFSGMPGRRLMRDAPLFARLEESE